MALTSSFFIDATSKDASAIITDYLFKKLKYIFFDKRPIVIVCIGTDRATGDSLGPIIGDNLKDVNMVSVYGSLKYPVHSQNLVSTINDINNKYKDPYIIAIDASLGSFDNIGKIFIEDKPLQPGLALNKDLPPIGDLSITGIVNISGNFEFMVLQNTRLYTVMLLANAISNGLIDSLNLLASYDFSKENLI